MIRIQTNFNCFKVPNSFVDKYMCEANGSYIKVYLFLLRHVTNNNLEIGDIANALNLMESDVLRAFKYWNKLNVIEYIQHNDNDFSIKIIDESIVNNIETDIQQEQRSEKSTPAKFPTVPTAVSYSKNDINTYMRNNEGIRHMFLISEQLLSKTLTDTERKILFGFYDYLSMPVEVIFTLLEYCISIGKTNMRYIEKVAYTWADKEINTLAKASSYVKEVNELNNIYKRFKTMFKISGRDFTSTEEAYIKSWVYDLKFNDKQIEAAYETTVANTGKIAFKYMDAVLKNSSNENNDYKQSNTIKAKNSEKKNFFQDYDNEMTEYDLQLIRDRLSRDGAGEM